MLQNPHQRTPHGFGCALLLLVLPDVGRATTLYAFGNPTPDEQAIIERINWAREFPVQEGQRLAQTTDPEILASCASTGVDKTMLQNELALVAKAPPLVPNAALMTCARNHSQWMLATATQAHDENPSNSAVGSADQRMTVAGYSWSTCGENVFAYGRSNGHSHAAFEIDWGTGSGGMLNGRGHRTNIHSPNFRELGVGVVNGSNTSGSDQVGPQLVTQDFGATAALPTFGTGVAYYDLNSNNAFDAGEGIAGLTVTATGSSYHCLTAAGGGWVLPVPGAAATRTITFTGNGINSNTNLTFTANTNAKADLRLSYVRPTITSAATATANTGFTFTFQAGSGATSHVFRRAPLQVFPAENGESTANVTATIDSAAYSLLNTSVKQQGASSFHLAHASTSNQSFQLNTVFFGGASPQLSFQSFLRYATTTERALVQVQEDGAAGWTDVYAQAGTGGQADSAFTARTASLATVANKRFRIRFLYQLDGNSFFQGNSNLHGWFVDAIQVTGASALGTETTATLASTSNTFTPSTGTFLLSVAPLISDREFPPATQTLVVQPPAGFATWAATMETTGGLNAGTIGNQPDADHDHDGRSNLYEYAFGTSAIVAESSRSPREPVAGSTPTHFTLRYQRDTSLADVSFAPQVSLNCTTWHVPGESGAPAGFSDALVSTANGIETREARIPRDTAKHTFLRLRLVKP